MPPKGRIVVSDLYAKDVSCVLEPARKQVIALDLNRMTAKGYHPASLIEDGCTGCAMCAIVCPEAAITVYREDLRARRRNPRA